MSAHANGRTGERTAGRTAHARRPSEEVFSSLTLAQSVRGRADKDTDRKRYKRYKHHKTAIKKPKRKEREKKTNNR